MSARIAKADQTRDRAEVQALWNRLHRTSRRGLAYLRRHGLEDLADDCRFGRGTVCLPLRGPTGRISNVVALSLDDPNAREVVLAGSSIGVFGDARKMPVTTGPICLTAGATSWLWARAEWPWRLVLGAVGAGGLPDVARVVAPLAVASGRGVLLVPDRHDIGTRYTGRIVAALVASGVPIVDIEVFKVGEEFDDLTSYIRAVQPHKSTQPRGKGRGR